MSHPAPGQINAHTHIYSALVPLGMPPPQPPPENFLQILARVWWRLDRALDADILAAGARLYVAEALLAGTTGLIDHQESPAFVTGCLDVLADACQDLGMPAVLCYGATERNRGRAEADKGLAECARFIRDNQRPLVRGVVGLHASFTVSDDTIRAAAALARELDTVLHVHMAEDRADVDDARARGYDSPLQRLIQLDALIPGSILAHGVHLRPDEVAECGERGVWLVQNPRSNRGNRVGYPSALGSSDKVALGTDGFPADMTAELTALREEAGAHGDDLARAERRLGAGHELLAERFGGQPPAVEAGADHVTVAGRPVVQGGSLHSGDIAAIRAEAARQAERLWARMATIKETPS
ncbi:amidohydrolase family protein [Haliangium sp.]|uniref:amidohydrolase family protein n=1 Tax=Haliangium sp. TaxID=2663208 RepID=UPI003D0FAC27